MHRVIGVGPGRIPRSAGADSGHRRRHPDARLLRLFSEWQALIAYIDRSPVDPLPPTLVDRLDRLERAIARARPHTPAGAAAQLALIASYHEGTAGDGRDSLALSNLVTSLQKM